MLSPIAAGGARAGVLGLRVERTGREWPLHQWPTGACMTCQLRDLWTPASAPSHVLQRVVCISLHVHLLHNTVLPVASVASAAAEPGTRLATSAAGVGTPAAVAVADFSVAYDVVLSLLALLGYITSQFF